MAANPENPENPENPNADVPQQAAPGILDHVDDFFSFWFGQHKEMAKEQKKVAKVKTKEEVKKQKEEERNQKKALRETAQNPENQEAPEEGGARNILDIDGDGDVDLEDMMAGMEADVDEGEAEEDHAAEHKPWYMGFQILICAGFWIVGSIMTAMEEDSGDFFPTWISSMGGLETFVPDKTSFKIHSDCEDYRWEVWRWFTYQYTHGDVQHILMNSVLVLLCGFPLEMFDGTLRMILVFNIGVIGGACAQMVSNPHASGLVGMSGGCYSLLGMHMSDLVMNWRQIRWRKPKLLALLGLMVVDIVSSQLSHPDDATGHSAHFGGWLAGLLMGIVCVRNLKVEFYEKIIMATAIIIGLGLMGFCIGWNTSWPPRSVWDDNAWCWPRQVWNPEIFGDNEYHCVRCGDQACIDEFSVIPAGVAAVNYKECDAAQSWWN